MHKVLTNWWWEVEKVGELMGIKFVTAECEQFSGKVVTIMKIRIKHRQCFSFQIVVNY